MIVEVAALVGELAFVLVFLVLVCLLIVIVVVVVVVVIVVVVALGAEESVSGVLFAVALDF